MSKHIVNLITEKMRDGEHPSWDEVRELQAWAVKASKAMRQFMEISR